MEPIDSLKTIAELYSYSTAKFAGHQMNRAVDSPAGYTYSEFKQTCDRFSRILSIYGVGAGDRVAVFSAGCVNWSVAFFSAAAFGRVAVPILPDFTASEASHVLAHSEAKALIASKKQIAKLGVDALEGIHVVFDIDTLEVYSTDGHAAPFENPSNPTPDSLAAIIYTSGTTGTAKGVMLTHRNFMANMRASVRFYPLCTKDVMLSVLPLAHTYELSLGMLYPFSCGSQVCYISKAPSPTYLMKVMKEVRPTAMLTVPLIIEKVYKGTILPMIRKSRVLSWMDRHMNLVLTRIIGQRMIATFGGRMRFFGIGGAKLDIDVERFLHRAKFPYQIGYGLTECAPLLALAHYNDTTPGQIGAPVYGVELRLDNINPETGEGEIVARGENIMPGYYKDPDRSFEAFTPDGWFRTKDIACVDEHGRFAIRGRLGNMIVGASGENIYPEEIEKVVKEIPTIEDVIVVCRGSRLVGLVKVADSVSLEAEEALASFKASVVRYVNERVTLASHLNSVEVMTCPFEKTATLKIRRFLYAKEAPTK